MFEANQVFPHREAPNAQSPSAERRLILAPLRKNGSGSRSRVVEVVQVRRGNAKRPDDHSLSRPRNVRAETWPEGFRAKSPGLLPPDELRPATSEPTQPVAHVMPIWESSPRQPASPAEKPTDPAVRSSAVKARRKHSARPSAPKVAERHFANPFAETDDGANCVRCGYLVEQARDRRGLRTCSRCG
jgi:hypothetical protein